MTTWDYLGYRCELNGASYNCPGLRLYGYATPTQLESAMRRELKRRAKHGRKWNPGRRRNPPPRESSGGGNTMLLLALVGGAAFVMLTSSGQQMWAQLTAGIGGSSIPAGLPVGTVRLSNGQYRLPTGQVVGPAYAGYQPVAGSNTQMLISGAVAAAPTLASWLARLFSGGSSSSGGGSGGVDTPAVIGDDLSLPLPGGGSGGVDTPAVVGDGGAGSIVLADGTVLDLGSFEGFDLTPISFGVDTGLQLPDLWGGGAVIPDVSIPEAPIDAGMVWPGFTGYGRFGDMPRPKNPYLYDVPVPMMMLPGPR